MAEITIVDLKDYRHIQREIKSIEAELEWIYLPSSPSGNTSGAHSTTPGDPTVRTWHHIQALQSRRERLQKKIDTIDSWILTLEDHQLAAIIRCRYIIGMSWEEVSRRICGSYNEATARSIVRRHFGTS